MFLLKLLWFLFLFLGGWKIPLLKPNLPGPMASGILKTLLNIHVYIYIYIYKYPYIYVYVE